MVHDVVWITCGKCGFKVDVRVMRQRMTYSCLECKEPLPDLQELERCEWEEGDQNEGILSK